MPMTAKGFTKLSEELNELGVEVAKKLAFYHTNDHPDGKGLLNERLENEMGDVIAAIRFVRDKNNLSLDRIAARAETKYELFRKWDDESELDYQGVDKQLVSANVHSSRLAIEKFLRDNNPEGFGCACSPGGTLCGPCSEAKRQEPLHKVLARLKELDVL